MKIFLTKKFIIGLILLLFILPIIYFSKNTESINAQKNDTFLDLLNANNVTVIGSDFYLSKFQLKGFINMIDTENNLIVEKYNDKLPTNDNLIKLNANEVLELHYYSLSTNGQKNFMKDISNKKVDVSMADASILISYN